MKPILKQTETEVGINNIKFYKFSGEVPNEFFNFIDMINTALDLPQLEETQIMLIAKFIMYEFTTLTMKDIENAIFKAKAGKLDCNPADYNKLSIDFIGRVLNSYQEYKKKEQLKIKLEQEKEPLKIEYTPDDEKEAYLFLKGIYDKGQEPFIANWNLAFKFMEENNLINLSNDEKQIFFEMTIEDLKAEMQELKVKKKNIHRLKSLLNDKELIKQECRKRIIIKHFKNGN